MIDYEKLCNEYRENKRLIEELNAMQDTIKQQLIEALNGQECAIFGAAKVSNISFTQTRLDSTALKKAMPDIYIQYSKTSACKRFFGGLI